MRKVKRYYHKKDKEGYKFLKEKCYTKEKRKSERIHLKIARYHNRDDYVLQSKRHQI